jgi:microcystin-dependent protein
MVQPYLGEIRPFSFPGVPTGWAACNGQLLSIAANSALFALIGTTFGGNGVSTFQLPDLRGRTPFGSGSSTTVQGEMNGTESVTLLLQQVPPHNHSVSVNSADGTTQTPAGAYLAQNEPRNMSTPFNVYAPFGTAVALNVNSVTVAGTSGPHENRQPSLVINYCIALTGVFPSRN